jgi:hypothetical protein
MHLLEGHDECFCQQQLPAADPHFHKATNRCQKQPNDNAAISSSSTEAAVGTAEEIANFQECRCM